MADVEQAYQQYQAEQAFQSYQAQQKPPPDVSAWNQYVKANLAAQKPEEGQQAPTPPPAGPEPHPAEGWLQALEAGWQTSVSGLITRHKLPDTVVPENAPMAVKILQGMGQTVGDIPAILAGTAAGGAAGSEVPVIGNAAGAAAGAWGLPSAMRRYYMDSIQKGQVTSFGDLFTRMASSLWDGLKSGTVGAATAGIGPIVQPLIGEAAPIATQVMSKLAAQVATMSAVGAGMDNRAPTAQEFTQNALMLAGMESAPHLVTKLQEAYAQTGLRPSEIAQQAAVDPVLKQELLAADTNLPPSLKDKVEPSQPNQEMISSNPEFKKAEIPSELAGQHPALNSEFNSPNEPEVAKAQPEEEPKASEPSEPQTARDKILASIGQGSTEAKADRFDSVYAHVVDKLNPVRKLVDAITDGEKLPVNEDPYALLATAKSKGFARADESVKFGPVDFESGKPTGKPGLQQILEPFQDDPNGLKAYGMARRALELSERGVNVGIDLDASKEYVEANKGKYEKAFSQIVDWQNSGLKYLKDSGVLSQDQHDEIVGQNKAYFPMNVIQEEGSGGGKSSSNPIKKIFGSDEKKIDPFEQMVKNQYAYYRIAEENRGKAALVNLADGSDFVKRVSATMRGIKISPEELNSYLTKYGIHEGDADAMTVFRPLALPLQENQFAVMENGKRSVYEADPSIAKAMSATDYQEPNMIQKVANAFATVQRLAITENPFFLLKHAVRDQAMATIQSNNGYKYGYDGLRGLSHFFRNSEDYMEFLRQGGGMSTIVDFDKQYVSKDIWGLSKETGLLDKSLNVVKTPFDLMRTLAEATFTAPKMGEYLRAIENGKDSATAAYEARKVTVDVQQQGSAPLMSAWNAATPFFQMRIRGLDRMVESFQDNPTRTATKLALAVTLPSIATWWAFKDDDRYKNAANWEKDMYWLLPIGGKDGPTMKIPKPFEPGLLFGSLFERTLDEFYAKKPEAFKGFGEGMLSETAPNVVPPVLLPAIQQFANRSWLTGGNIVPDRLKSVAPEYQYNPYTTETAKLLGKMISYVPGAKDAGPGNVTLASPMVIESYVRAWTGNVGMYALQAADKALETAGVASPPPKPAMRLSDIPFVNSFVARYPSAGAQPIQDFYDNLQKATTTFETKNYLAKQGNFKALSDYMASPEAQENMMKLTGMQKSLSAQNAMIQKIYANPEIKPDEKRQMIDGLYYQMIQISGTGNKMIAQMRKKSEGM